MSETWKRNPARQRKSFINKAALRVFRDEAAFQIGLHAIERRLRVREREVGRELLLSEIETECEHVVFTDVVEFIRSTPC